MSYFIVIYYKFWIFVWHFLFCENGLIKTFNSEDAQFLKELIASEIKIAGSDQSKTNSIGCSWVFLSVLMTSSSYHCFVFFVAFLCLLVAFWKPPLGLSLRFTLSYLSSLRLFLLYILPSFSPKNLSLFTVSSIYVSVYLTT